MRFSFRWSLTRLAHRNTAASRAITIASAPTTTAKTPNDAASAEAVTRTTIPAGLRRYGTASGKTASCIGSLPFSLLSSASEPDWPCTTETEMTSRMIPLAMLSAPVEKCSSLVRSPPRTRRRTAAAAAVVSIFRTTRPFVAAGMSAVRSRNGTRAIFGPTPIRSSRKISITAAALTDSNSINPQPSVQPQASRPAARHLDGLRPLARSWLTPDRGRGAVTGIGAMAASGKGIAGARLAAAGLLPPGDKLGAHLDRLYRAGGACLQRQPDSDQDDAQDEQRVRPEHKNADAAQNVGRGADHGSDCPAHGGGGQLVAFRVGGLHADEPGRNRHVADHHDADDNAQREREPPEPPAGEHRGCQAEAHSDSCA